MEIRLEEVVVERDGRPLVRAHSVCIAPGRVTALLGPAGAGKTALLELVAGLARPATGAVFIGGERVATGRRKPSNVAVALQPPEFGRGSVRTVLEGSLRGVERGERAPRVRDAAEALAIETLLERDARSLSGREARAVNLARTLVRRAPVTLLDEPLGGLDGAVARRFGEALRAGGGTVVIAGNAAEAIALGDDLVVVANGEARAVGPLSDALAAPPDPVTAALLGYALLDTDAGPVAVWPGMLSVGTGAATFTLVVERALVVSGGVEVWGSIGEAAVRVRLGAGLPAPRSGSKLAVSAPPGAFARFPKQGPQSRKIKGPGLDHETPESR